MELDQFKNELRTTLAADQTNRTSADIAQMLDKSPASLIRKSLIYEIIFGFVMIIGFIFLAFYQKLHYLRIYFAAFVLLIMVIWIVLIHLLLRTNTILQTTSIKTNLESYIQLIESFVKKYQVLTMALVPICMVSAAILGLIEKNNQGKHLERFQDLQWSIGFNPIAAALFIAAVMLISLVQYYFSKWYIHQLYGKYLSDLKKCLHDLDSNPL